MTLADDASPEAFHNSNQTILLSPEISPTGAPHGNDTSTGGDATTPSPLQALQLFPRDGGDTAQYLSRPSSEVQVSLNMSDVREEEGKHGDGDSIADAIESVELEEALEESLCDQLLILIKNKGEEVSKCEMNRILLKKSLAAEVSMSSIPLDWTPRLPKQKKANPCSILLTIPGSGPSLLTA